MMENQYRRFSTTSFDLSKKRQETASLARYGVSHYGESHLIGLIKGKDSSLLCDSLEPLFLS